MDESFGHPFGHQYRVRYHDCGPDLRLSVPAALRYFEELALLQSDSLGVGFDYYRDKDVAWMLSMWDLRVGDLPACGEAIEATTLPLRYRGFMADRRFTVEGGGKAPAVEGIARWTFLDTGRMRPARIPTELAEVYGMGPPDGPMPPMDDPADVGREDIVTTLTTRPDDIDINGHVNNVRYVEWALTSAREALPGDARLHRLRVKYRKETLSGAALRIVASIDETVSGLRVRHAVMEGGEVACSLETIWRTGG